MSHESLPFFVRNSALRQELRRRPPISVHHHRPLCPDAAPLPPRPGPAPLPSQSDPYCLLTFHQNLVLNAAGKRNAEGCRSRLATVTKMACPLNHRTRFSTVGDLSAGTQGTTKPGCTCMVVVRLEELLSMAYVIALTQAVGGQLDKLTSLRKQHMGYMPGTAVNKGEKCHHLPVRYEVPTT